MHETIKQQEAIIKGETSGNKMEQTGTKPLAPSGNKPKTIKKRPIKKG